MSRDLPPQANYWGIGPDELRILLVVAHWFNGKTLNIHGEDRQIGTHHDLPLKDLFLGTSFDYNNHKAAHERLLANDILEEEYVCRRKIDWAPTEQGIRAIRDCLQPWDDQLRPKWADESESGVIYGDPNERVLHRKGVEVAAHALQFNAWTFRPNGRPYGMTWYPDTDRDEVCHDFHIATADHLDNIGVEVTTANNNPDYLVNKWEGFAKGERLTLWLFDSRDTACGLFNALNKRGLLSLDGGQFTTPANWSAQAINHKLWRSECDNNRIDISDVVHTVTGILEGDNKKLHNLFSDYYSKTS